MQPRYAIFAWQRVRTDNNTTAQLSHAALSPRRVASLRARHSSPKLSMGSLQRLRTALDFNTYFQTQHDLAAAQLAAQHSNPYTQQGPAPMEM